MTKTWGLDLEPSPTYEGPNPYASPTVIVSGLKYSEDQPRDELGRFASVDLGISGRTTLDKTGWATPDYPVNPYTANPAADLAKFMSAYGWGRVVPNISYGLYMNQDGVTGHVQLTGVAAFKIADAYVRMEAAIGRENIPDVSFQVLRDPPIELGAPKGVVAYSEISKGQITLLMNHPDWKGVGGLLNAQASVDHKWLTQPNAVIHEMGHFVDRSLTEGFRPDIHDAVGESRLMTSHLVSDYAGTNNHEYVAEVFAGSVAGKRYSNEVKQTYIDMGGKVFK